MWIQRNGQWLILIGIVIIIIGLFKTNGINNVVRLNRDTVLIKGQPIINNYSFTNPTITKETTIIYDSTKKTLTKSDSDLIVIDYLKRREYQDSISNDSIKIKYTANVEKNHLLGLKIDYKYKPTIIKVTNYKYAAFYLGMAPGITDNQNFSLALNSSYAWKFGQVGVIADPFKRNYYLYVSKRLSFK